MIDQPRITKPLAAEAEAFANESHGEEVGGIFFFPVPGPWDDDPAFLRLDNIHLEPEKHFQFDYVDMAQAIIEKYGEANGTFAMFHSHPFGTGQPSRDDDQAVEIMAKEMDGHPLWRPLERHMIFSLWDLSWWWHDLLAFGRVGWKWPDA
jgi:proteasome lid subunit RPN8/RPN11